jgi:hypothetical protein
MEQHPDRNHAPTDWEMALRIGKAADQVMDGMRASAPKKAMWGLSLVQMWDLTGQVEELPDLGIVCTTTVGFPGSRYLSYVGMNVMGGGAGTLTDDGKDRTVIVFPNMLRASANRRQIEAEGFLHHELAHFLYRHEPDDAYEVAKNARKVAEAYFNHPMEVDAYFHQGLAALVRSRGGRSWADCDLEASLGGKEDFFSALLPEMPAVFRKYVTAETLDLMRRRAERFWDAGHEALLVSKAGLAAPGRV